MTWIHVAEVYCFLEAHLRYLSPELSVDDQNQYFNETAIIAHLMGATSVPTTRRAVEEYLLATRPQLRWDRRTRRVASTILSSAPPSPAFAPFSSLLLDAGVDLLPAWAADMHGFKKQPRQKRAVRACAMGVGAILRWAMSVDAKR